MQQRAHDAPHVRIVINDEKAQRVEIDADHIAPRARAAPGAETEGKVLPVNARLNIQSTVENRRAQ
jgi:hypothetical protein